MAWRVIYQSPQFGDGKKYIEASCDSGDTKETADLAQGSRCVEVDTGYVYLYSETSGWVSEFTIKE